MKAFAAVLAFSVSLPCVIAGSAWGATPYQSSVVNKACLSQTSCTFTFPTATGPTGTSLTITHVSCRIVNSIILPIPNTSVAVAEVYADLHSSATDIDPLPLAEGTLFGNLATGPTYSLFLINSPVLHFVALGVAPVVTIATGAAISAPNGNMDEPTCHISGYVE
jgi:hypothetical protein